MKSLTSATIQTWLSEEGSLRGTPLTVGAPMASEIHGVCVDSRLAEPGTLFVALPGERTDGHNYADDAVARGSVAILVSYDRLADVASSLFGSALVIPVDDTLLALQRLARRWREQHPDLLRIAITGSNGKTSCKELISSILSKAAPTVHSRGNYNSDIGMPVELLRIRERHRFGVFEAGMNRPGEIAELAALLNPDVALITNVGSAHIGMIGSRRGIAEEKKAIFSQFNGSQTAVVPASGEFSRYLATDINGSVIRHSRKSAGVVDVRPIPLHGSQLELREGPVTLPLSGSHMVANAIAAITVARILEVPFEHIKAGVESVRPVFGRAEVLRGRVTIIQDCYNANPESMETALELLAEAPEGARKVAILGAMKELGEDSDRLHRSLVRMARESSADEVWLVGDEFSAAASDDDVTVFASDQWEDLTEKASAIADGSVVLLKGSRLLELERLTPAIQECLRPVGGRHADG